MENGTPRTVPRAFYPDYMDQPPAVRQTPGWDPGPERRLAERYTLRRVLGWSSIGIAAIGLALSGGRERGVRLLAGVALLAGAAGLDLLLSRQPRWAQGENGGEPS